MNDIEWVDGWMSGVLMGGWVNGSMDRGLSIKYVTHLGTPTNNTSHFGTTRIN